MLDVQLAAKLARLAIDGILQEYPHGEVVVLDGPADLRPPREMHPAFFGCFDWHSAVHSHWMLVRLLKCFDIPGAREAMRETLTAANILAEAEFMLAPHRKGFERMYGWAWLLKLCQELNGWNDADGLAWRQNLGPLEGLIVDRYLEFLPKQSYPIRVGTHTNTAFGLAFAYDYALADGREDLRTLLAQRARDYFGQDKNYPAHLEPGGADFLSSSLVEADLMRRVLPAREFAEWLDRFLPDGLPPSLQMPPTVTDRSDGQIGHLDGLTLSRLWCLEQLAKASPNASLHAQLVAAAETHRKECLSGVFSGDYAGEHWLASFAVLALG